MPFALPRPAVLFLLGAAVSTWMCLAMPVFSQEAYYWTYAQHPDLSYFDHPPMVAWLIWLGTNVFGDGALGIRFGTWVCGLCTAWFGVLLLRCFGIGREGQSTWLLLGLAVPILAMTRFLANPDAGLVCFWTLTMLALWRARSGSLLWWSVAGFAAGAAMLSKYTGVFLGAGGICLLLFDEPMRRQLRKPGPYLGVLIAAVVFSPVVIWNAQNHFESFRFQTEGRWEAAKFGGEWITQLLLGQLLVFHPALALLLPAAVWWLCKRAWSAGRSDARPLWLLAFGLPLPLYLLSNSLWIQVKINWLAPAYVPLLLGMVVWWTERAAAATALAAAGERVSAQRFWRVAKWSVLVMPLLLLFTPLVRLVSSGHGSSWSGWDQLAERAEHWEETIDPADGVEGNVFFFAPDYKDAAQLTHGLKRLWQGAGKREKIPAIPDLGEPTLAQNVIGLDALQFDHWEDPKRRLGQDAILVLPRPTQRQAMVDKTRLCFESIEKVERVTIQTLGIDLLEADIYVCRHYRGPLGKQ